MSKKTIVTGTALVILLSIAGLFATYLYCRSRLKEVPQLIQAELQKNGIILKFEKIESPPIGLTLILRTVQIEGAALPISLKSESFSTSIGMSGSWPPFAFTTELKRVGVEKNLEQVPPPEKPSQGGSGSSLKYAGLAASLVQIRFKIEDLSSTSYGVEHLSLAATAKGFRFSKSGIDHFNLSHELSIQHLADVPWLMGVHTNGTAVFDTNLVTTKDFQMGVGPFLVNIDAKLDTFSKAWSGTFSIPKSELSLGSKIVNSKALSWIKPESGQVQMNLAAQGNGSDAKSIKAKGTIQFDQATLNINHAEAKGKLSTNIYSSFTKDGDTVVDLKGDVDLTEMGISHQDTFAKERGIPLKIAVNLKGNQDQMSFPTLDLTFHNLHASAEGTYADKAKALNLTFKVPTTSLVGWERFFPKYSSIHTQGTLEANGSFKGPVEDWKSGALNVDLKAQDVKIPILQSWIPNKSLQMEGVIDLSSITKIELSQSSIRALSTQTEINMKENQLSYGDLFSKKRGIPLSASLIISSTNNKADIRKAVLQMGTLVANAKGMITNFANPSANLKIDMAPFNLTELFSFLPTAKAKAVSQMQGVVGLKATVTGPLLSKYGPSVSGLLDLKRLALIYELEATKKKINLTQLSGALNFTKDSIATKRFLMSFPHSDFAGAFEIRSFSKPDISFSVDAPRFTLADFYDLPKGQAIPPGAVPVPISSGKNKNAAEDFRTNPMLQNMKVKGTAVLHNADLGYTKTDFMSASISLDNLLLQIHPFVMRLYGGKITSETDWNGRLKTPTTKQTLKIENVNANQFISSYTEKGKDILEGSLSSNMNITFAGMEPEEIKKSLVGKGTFNLKDGTIKTLRLTKGPLESLKKVPFIGKGINQTEWNEKLNEVNGNFEFRDGKLLLSNLILHAPYFDAATNSATIDMNQNLQATMVWTPKTNLVTGESYEALKDENGKTSLPLVLSGTLTAPSIAIDQGVMETRLKGYASRKMEAEKNKAVGEVKKKAEDELKKKLNQGLGNIFK